MQQWIQNQPNEQACFRFSYSATDHTNDINLVVEKYVKYIKTVCMAFIGYEKAFHWLETSVVMKGIKWQGLEEIYMWR